MIQNMLRLQSRSHVILFALALTFVTVAAQVLRDFLVLPPEVFKNYALVNLGFTGAITFPLGVAAGRQLRISYRSQQNLDRLISYDTLTRALTRRRFFELQAGFVQQRGVLLIVDVDNFKQVNDTFGHLVGDQVLSEVASALMSHCRNVDLVCRYGGEEFLVFFPKVTPEAGALVCERLRLAVAENVHLSGSPVTVSGGWAVKPEGKKATDLIQAADQALLRAKSDGRNRFYAVDHALCITRQTDAPDVPRLSLVT